MPPQHGKIQIGALDPWTIGLFLGLFFWTNFWTIFWTFFILKEQFFFHLADALIILIKSTQMQITELLYNTRFTSGHKTEDCHSLVIHLNELFHDMF